MNTNRSELRVLQWPFVTRFAGSELVNFAEAIPVFGYLILFNDQVLGSLSFFHIAGIEQADRDPFLFSSVSKLRFAFFGGICMLIANSIQAWRSPRVLSHSRTDLEFAELVVATYSFGEIVPMQKEVLSEEWRWRTPFMRALDRNNFGRLPKHPDLSAFSDKNFIMSKTEDYLRALSREWWSGQMHADQAWRYAILAIAGAGYVMLLIPTLDITQAVVADLLRSLSAP